MNVAKVPFSQGGNWIAGYLNYDDCACLAVSANCSDSVRDGLACMMSRIVGHSHNSSLVRRPDKSRCVGVPRYLLRKFWTVWVRLIRDQISTTGNIRRLKRKPASLGSMRDTQLFRAGWHRPMTFLFFDDLVHSTLVCFL